MRAVLIAAAAALALSGCGAPTPSADSHRSKPTVVSAQPPTNLPAYLKAYPGARVLKSVSNQRGGVLLMETDAAPDTVIDFYKAAASQAGLHGRFDSKKVGFGIRIGPHVVVFSAAHKGRFTASAEAKHGVTKVDLLYAAS